MRIKRENVPLSKPITCMYHLKNSFERFSSIEGSACGCAVSQRAFTSACLSLHETCIHNNLCTSLVSQLYIALNFWLVHVHDMPVPMFCLLWTTGLHMYKTFLRLAYQLALVVYKTFLSPTCRLACRRKWCNVAIAMRRHYKKKLTRWKSNWKTYWPSTGQRRPRFAN